MLVKFRFERLVSNSAQRPQNKYKKNWREQTKLLDALSDDVMRKFKQRR